MDTSFEIERIRLGALHWQLVTPNGVEYPPKSTDDVRGRIAPFPLEDVLAACVLECRGLFQHASMARVIGAGPYAGFSVTLPGLAYVARQALIICSPAGRFPDRVDTEVSNFVARAAIDAQHHISVSPEPDAPVDEAQSVGMLLAMAGWQYPFFPKEAMRRLPRYLALFDEPLATHWGIGANLGEAFAAITDVAYRDFLGVVIGILSLVMREETFSPAFTMDTLRPLWTELPWSRWCNMPMVEAVLARLSLPLDEHRRLAAEGFPESGIPPDEPFSFNPLLKWPFIRLTDGHFLAPVPQYALTRVTEGATFDIADRYRGESRGGNRGLAALGDAVERYVGRLLHHAYGDGMVLDERQYGDGTHGPDFVVVNNRSVLLIEVKKAQPTLPINERGDMDIFATIMRRNVVDAINGLPAKEANVLGDDRLPAYLRRGHRSTAHVVVTLGTFVGQSWWWNVLMTPWLREAGYDVGREHHLVSIADLEEATIDDVPTLNSLLRRSWKHGPGAELAIAIQELRNPRWSHGVLDPLWHSWARKYYDYIPSRDIDATTFDHLFGQKERK
jgi:hypothetical protein